MKIGHVGIINFNIPSGRGGPERVFYDLNEALAKLGAELKVFACKNSKVSGELKYLYPKELNSMKEFLKADRKDRVLFSLKHIANAYINSSDVDIYLNHYGKWGLPVASSALNKKTVMVVHTYDIVDGMVEDDNKNIYYVCPTIAVSKIISKYTNNFTVINHGINVYDIVPSYKKGSYYLYVGRLVRNKGLDLAISFCRDNKEKLVIIGKPDKRTLDNRIYFGKEISPLLDSDFIDYIPEVGHDKIFSFYKKAKAFIFPVRDCFQETFGLVMVEALATGTPVLALSNPLTEELIRNGVTGLLFEDEKHFVEQGRNVEKINRAGCRKEAEERFDRSVMAAKYLDFLGNI